MHVQDFPLWFNGIGSASEAPGHRFDPWPCRWAKDPLWPQLWCRSQLRLGSDPWPRTPYLMGGQKRKRKKLSNMCSCYVYKSGFSQCYTIQITFRNILAIKPDTTKLSSLVFSFICLCLSQQLYYPDLTLVVNTFCLDFCCMFILIQLISVARTHQAVSHAPLAQEAYCFFSLLFRMFLQPEFICQRGLSGFGRQSPGKSFRFPVILDALLLSWGRGDGGHFSGLHPWHMEVPRLGVESKLQLPAYTTATATGIRAMSSTYTTAHSWILNPLSKARDQTCILWIPVGLFLLRHNGNSGCLPS